MDISQVLRTIAIVSAWSRGDEEAVQLLITEAGPQVIPDLIELLLMVLVQNTDGHPREYLAYLSEQAMAIQASEAARSN